MKIMRWRDDLFKRYFILDNDIILKMKNWILFLSVAELINEYLHYEQTFMDTSSYFGDRYTSFEEIFEFETKDDLVEHYAEYLI